MTYSRRSTSKAVGGGFWKLKAAPKTTGKGSINIPDGYYWDGKCLRKKKPGDKKPKGGTDEHA